MNRDKKFYWQLFKSTFIVSMFTVGGASVTLDPAGAIKFYDMANLSPRSNFFV